MHKIVQSILFAILLFGGWGCTKELQSDNGEGKQNEIKAPLALSVRSILAPYGVITDAEMSSLRVIVFRANANGQAIGSPIFNNKYTPNAVSYDINELVPVGNLTVCLIANEMMPNDFGTITGYAQLEAERWNYVSASTDYLEAPFPMFSVYRGMKIDTSGKITINGVDAPTANGKAVMTIERSVAKVKLKLIGDFDKNSILPIKLTNACVRSIPTHPWLFPKPYSDNGIPADDNFYSLNEIPLADDIFESTATGFKLKDDEELIFYLPEHIVDNTQNYSYIELGGELLSTPSMKVVYKLPLGNGLGVYSAKALNDRIGIDRSNYNVTRNTEYDITATIVNLGELNGIEVKQNVKSWTGVSVDGQIAVPYLNLSAVSTTISGGSISRIYFWTNQSQSTVAIKPIGRQGSSGGAEFNVADVFTDLVGVTPSNFNYNETTGEGYFNVLSSQSTTGKYILYLTAGNLVREIVIDLVNP